MSKRKPPKPRCDECYEPLEKAFIFTEFKVVIVGWVCPKSEMVQVYKQEYEKR